MSKPWGVGRKLATPAQSTISVILAARNGGLPEGQGQCRKLCLPMNLVIRSYTPEHASQLELLTLGAELVPSEITFDALTSSVIVPMTRGHYRRKRIFFGMGEGYERISPETTESLLIVRDVVQHQLHDQHWVPEISLLFGVKLTKEEVYLCSVQESVGVLGFELRINIRSVDIELRDKEFFA